MTPKYNDEYSGWFWPLMLVIAVGVLCFIVATAGGCSFVLPSHANVIDQHAGNAQAINNLVQADANMPPYVKQWWNADAEAWKRMSDWAHGRKPIKD